MTALRFFFRVTLARPDIGKPSAVRPRAAQAAGGAEPRGGRPLLEAAPGLKYKAALGVAYGAGLRVVRGRALKVGDIDSKRMLIRVEQGKGRKDRNAMLSPQLLELLRDWWQRRALPQGWLFPGPQPSSRSRPASSIAPATRPPGGRDQQAGVAAHAAAQLRHPSAGAGRRHPRDPGPARNGDILPTNTRSRGGSTIGSIPDAARPY